MALEQNQNAYLVGVFLLSHLDCACMQVPFKGHELKTFTGIIASISGAYAKEKGKYAELLKQFGGVYSPELTRQCSHLIIMRRHGSVNTPREMSAKET